VIFFAGSLNMNGGSTFLLRVAKQHQARGQRITVAVLSNVIDDKVRAELEPLADVVMLRELLHPLFRWAGSNQVSIFLPSHRRETLALLSKHRNSVHVMGIFGLILAMRWLSVCPRIKISAGVYHQNEFLFEADDAFSGKVRRLFCELPEQNVLFFNEFNRDTYSTFFETNYAAAPVLPIGITLPSVPARCERTYVPGLIVSVGNLVTFKTYNEHVIKQVAELHNDYPELRYEIYGNGENEEKLRRLAAELGVLEQVSFKGGIPYDQFANVVSRAMAFVGSGTALIESAALGVPSIVGIESIAEPETYGLISDVSGLSYNERINGLPLVPIRSVLVRLLDSKEEVATAGRTCALKAREFSIDITVDGLHDLSENAAELNCRKSTAYWWRLLAGFLKVAVFDRLGIDRTLRERRNQSSHV
jgi:glycosyltransferase involved in cell wall biosynthesis